MTTVAIIQARMGSTRLAGKVLAQLRGEPVLAWCVERTRRCRTLDDVIVATTESDRDRPIVDLCRERGWRWSRGSENDVLDRYYRAATGAHASAVVRVTSDCPLIDPDVIDRAVETFRTARPEADHVSNFFPRTFPRGLDVEVFSFAALETAWREDDSPRRREHVTPYLYEHPGRFRLLNVENDEDLSAHRLTLDTAEDLTLLRAVADRVGGMDVDWREVVAFLDEHPEIAAINRHVRQKGAE